MKLQNMVIIVSIAALVLVAGCTGTNTSANQAGTTQNQPPARAQPDNVVTALQFKGCPSLITEQELDAATSWKSIDTQMYTGFYGVPEMNCDYYESVSALKYHVAYTVYIGGNEKLNNLTASWKNNNKDKQFSYDTIIGVASFSSKPYVLAFVDKETGIVVWLRLDTGNAMPTEADWNNLLSIGRAIDAKLN